MAALNAYVTICCIQYAGLSPEPFYSSTSTLFAAKMSSSHSLVQNSLLMLGDSLVAGFNWQHRIPQFTIHNFGVPGATTRELLLSLPHLKAHGIAPQLIMVMIGTNDVVMENFSFTSDLLKILTSLSNDYPTAEVMLNSLLPMQLPYLSSRTIAEINSHIAVAGRQTGCCFIDIYAKFLQSNAVLFQADGVHLTEQAYELWARTIIEHIAFPVESDYPEI